MSRILTVGVAQLGPIARAESRRQVVSRLVGMMEEAARMGMVWQVVDDAALMDEATKLARRLAAGPTLPYAAIKKALNAAGTNSLDRQLDLERDAQRELGRSADFKEGVAAFLAKRPAQFTGR